MDEISKEISKKSAEILLNIGCVNFSPQKLFKLTSGKLSPIYCDCRRIISFPKERNLLIKMLIEKLKNSNLCYNLSNISGGETAGIPFASFLASNLNLPMTYIRKAKKKFGKKNQIEGILKKEDKVLLVEDLMTDGGSKYQFIDAIEETGAQLIGICVIFNYGIHTEKFIYKNSETDLFYLTNWNEVLKVAVKKKVIKNSDEKIIKKFLLKIGIKN